MKSFILLQTRPEDAAAENEYESFLKFGQLDPKQLKRIRLHTGNVPTINFDNYTGIMIGGGPFTITDPVSKKSAAQLKCESGLLRLFDQIVDRDFPFLGSCFIGLLGKHQGGFISRKYTEPVAPVKISLTTEGKKDKLTRNLPETFWALGGHKEACEILPKSAVLLASSKTCPVQLYRVKNNIYASQFHPELDPESLALRINIYKNYGYFPPEEASELIKEVLASRVIEPVKMLRKFVEIYA